MPVDPSPTPMIPISFERMTATSTCGSRPLSVMAARNPALPPPTTMIRFTTIHATSVHKYTVFYVDGGQRYPVFCRLPSTLFIWGGQTTRTGHCPKELEHRRIR